MNKTELINVVAAETEQKKAIVEEVVNATLEAIAQALKNGEKVQLIGFGNFEVKKVEERTGRNPRTGEEITIEAYNKPTFTPSKVLKETVN
jgi:DNA-binding protein HU-beta